MSNVKYQISNIIFYYIICFSREWEGGGWGVHLTPRLRLSPLPPFPARLISARQLFGARWWPPPPNHHHRVRDLCP